MNYHERREEKRVTAGTTYSRDDQIKNRDPESRNIISNGLPTYMYRRIHWTYSNNYQLTKHRHRMLRYTTIDIRVVGIL